MQSDGHGNFGINVDTYETYFDTLDISFSKKLLSDYLKQKKHKFEELKDIYENQKIDCLINNNQDSSVFIADDYQLPFEQIIAHEAFHVYQILTSSVLAEYSFYKRRVGFWKYYAVDLLIREKLSFNRGKSLLSVLHSNCDSDPDPELSKFIKDIIDKDEKEVNGEGFIGIKNGEEFSLLDIVEGAAVRFQYISQEDFKEKKVALTTEATKYTATWEYFLSKAGIDREVSSNFISAQFVFIYLSDIFLKFYDIYFYSTRVIYEIY